MLINILYVHNVKENSDPEFHIRKFVTIVFMYKNEIGIKILNVFSNIRTFFEHRTGSLYYFIKFPKIIICQFLLVLLFQFSLLLYILSYNNKHEFFYFQTSENNCVKKLKILYKLYY